MTEWGKQSLVSTELRKVLHCVTTGPEAVWEWKNTLNMPNDHYKYHHAI